VCLAGGPLLLTELRGHGVLHGFGSETDVGFTALHHPLTLSAGLALQYYPAVTWMGFFFLGMLIGRTDVSDLDRARRLCIRATLAAAALFALGWWGAHAFAPRAFAFVASPPLPFTWRQNFTTYGFSEAAGWALSSAAVALAVLGACVWFAARPGRFAPAVDPVAALGAMSLTFYVLHFVYVGEVWPHIEPYARSTVALTIASVAFWAIFAAGARWWLAHFRRGPFETVLHAGALVLVAPFRAAGARYREGHGPAVHCHDARPAAGASARP
jgi:uncharacterized membrane protein YeiB